MSQSRSDYQLLPALRRAGVFVHTRVNINMPTAAVSATGVASVLVAATTRLWGSTPPPAVKVTPDGSFLSEWDEDATDGPPCNFYNASYQYTGALCSHFALARMSPATQTEALNRALMCASHYETDCILSPEIGLSIPAAFVYDELEGLAMIIAPKITPLPDDYESEERLVELRDPTEKRHAQIEMQTTISVEYLRGGARHMETRTFNKTAAYCIQLLRVAFDASCWSEID